MSKEKQIEEMAWDLCDIPKHPDIKSCEQCGNKHCHAMYYAERVYTAGYRKQSENTVEVVRCKDCFFGDVDTTGSGSVQCQNRDVPWRRYKQEFVMSPHDYCSYARAKQSEVAIAKNATTTGEWISVEERLPPAGKGVLVCFDHLVSIDFMRSDGQWNTFNADSSKCVTHWAPIPKMPFSKISIPRVSEDDEKGR